MIISRRFYFFSVNLNTRQKNIKIPYKEMLSPIQACRMLPVQAILNGCTTNNIHYGRLFIIIFIIFSVKLWLNDHINYPEGKHSNIRKYKIAIQIKENKPSLRLFHTNVIKSGNTQRMLYPIQNVLPVDARKMSKKRIIPKN